MPCAPQRRRPRWSGRPPGTWACRGPGCTAWPAPCTRQAGWQGWHMMCGQPTLRKRGCLGGLLLLKQWRRLRRRQRRDVTGGGCWLPAPSGTHCLAPGNTCWPLTSTPSMSNTKAGGPGLASTCALRHPSPARPSRAAGAQDDDRPLRAVRPRRAACRKVFRGWRSAAPLCSWRQINDAPPQGRPGMQLTSILRRLLQSQGKSSHRGMWQGRVCFACDQLNGA